MLTLVVDASLLLYPRWPKLKKNVPEMTYSPESPNSSSLGGAIGGGLLVGAAATGGGAAGASGGGAVGVSEGKCGGSKFGPGHPPDGPGVGRPAAAERSVQSRGLPTAQAK